MWYIVISSRILRFLLCYLLSSLIYLLIMDNISVHAHVPIPAPLMILLKLIIWPLQLIYLLIYDLNFNVLLKFILYLTIFVSIWLFLPKLVKAKQD